MTTVLSLPQENRGLRTGQGMAPPVLPGGGQLWGEGSPSAVRSAEVEGGRNWDLRVMRSREMAWVLEAQGGGFLGVFLLYDF